MSNNPDVIDSSTATVNLPPVVSNDSSRSHRPLIALLMGIDLVVILAVGSGLYFIQQQQNNHERSSISSLSTNLNSKIKSLSSQTQLSTSYPQNITLKNLTVTGQTTLSQLNTTSTKAGSVIANTINGSSFPGTSTISTTTLNATSTTKIPLGTQTTGSYVAELGALTGLSASDNAGAGSSPKLSVNYGSGANTAVEGDVTLNCTAAGSNLSGGGNGITLGSGGSCSSISVVSNPTFSSTITDTNSGGVGLALNGAPQSAANASLLQLGATISGGSSNGTYISVNQSGSSDFLNFQNGSTQELRVDSSGDTTIGGVLTVNGSGNGTDAGVLFQNTTDSSTAFEIQNHSGSYTLLDADTTTGSVGIGNDAPGAYSLDIGSGTSGSLNVGSTIYIDGTAICNINGCLGSGSSPPSAIDNTTTLQSGGANFFIQSTSGSAVTGTIEVLAAQVSNNTNVFQIVGTNGTTVLDSIGPTGSLTVASATVNGNLTANGHIITGNANSGTTTPSAGTGGTIVSFNGNDVAGTVSINTTDGAGGDGVVSVAFATDYSSGTAPHCVVSGDNSATAGLAPYCVATNSGISIGTHIATNTGSYKFDYFVTQ